MTADALHLLRQKGYKITGPRQKIIDYLATVNGHLSIHQIYKALNNNGNQCIGLTTVYRTMELLTSLGLSRAIALPDGQVLYEWSTPADHHHHLICSRCGRITEFSRCTFSGLKADIEALTHFKVESHRLEAFGTCRRCQARR